MKNRFLFILVFLIVASCGKREKKSHQREIHQPDSNAVKLNNKAVEFIGDAIHGNDSLSDIMYDSALNKISNLILWK